VLVLWNDLCALFGTRGRLESSDEAVRLQAIAQLQQELDDQAAHLPSHVFSGVVSRIFESGLELLNSDHKDRLVGLALLDCLLDVADDATAERRIETANILRKIVENDKQINYDPELLRAAAKSLGHLARVASTTEIEFLQTYAEKHVFKWLNDQRYEVRRFAAVLIVRELAINAPMIIFAKWKSAGVGKHVSNILQHLFNVIYDSKVQLREAAAEALAANLRLISEREYTDEHLRQSLTQLDVGFSQLTVEKSHGAMLILDVLLTVPSQHELANTMRNMQRDFQDVCWEVLQRKEHRDKSVRQKVLDLIPKMAAFIPKTFLSPNRFTQPNNFLTVSILHLLQLIRQGTDRQLAYYSLGKLFLAMASVLTKFRALIDDIFLVVRQGFTNPFCPEVSSLATLSPCCQLPFLTRFCWLPGADVLGHDRESVGSQPPVHRRSAVGQHVQGRSQLHAHRDAADDHRDHPSAQARRAGPAAPAHHEGAHGALRGGGGRANPSLAACRQHPEPHCPRD
jgi:FKBP12-rapamycin complex-associated protein